MNAVVHVVDDDAHVLKALGRVLSGEGLEVVLSASTREFLRRYDSSVAGCLVLDLAMPGMSGLELQSLLDEHGGGPPIVFLTGCGDVASSVRAMKAGAVDFLTKPVDIDALLEAVARALALDDAERRRQHESHDAQALLATLTPREREVVPHLMAGRLNKQIAADLGVCEKTVKVHRARILQKLHVRSLVDLVRFMARADGRAPTAPTTLRTTREAS
jgi:FixJ family two-component response regulator